MWKLRYQVNSFTSHYPSRKADPLLIDQISEMWALSTQIRLSLETANWLEVNSLTHIFLLRHHLDLLWTRMYDICLWPLRFYCCKKTLNNPSKFRTKKKEKLTKKYSKVWQSYIPSQMPDAAQSSDQKPKSNWLYCCNTFIKKARKIEIRSSFISWVEKLFVQIWSIWGKIRISK